MKNRWLDVIDIQLDLVDFLASRNGMAFGAGWFASNWLGLNWPKPPPGAEAAAALAEATMKQVAAPATDMLVWKSEDEARAAGAAWSLNEAQRLLECDPVYVDEEMMELVEAALAGFEPEPLREEDLITPKGMLILPRPMWLVPTADDTQTLNWSLAAWTRATELGPGRTPGIRLSLYHDQTEPDGLDEALIEQWLRDHKNSGVERIPSRWLPTHVVHWNFGTMHPGYQRRLGHEHVQLQVQAIWRLMNQTLAVWEQAKLPKQFAKRAARAGVPTSLVNLIRLRRVTHPFPTEDEKEVNWSHRWLVNGYWRWQWYADKKLENRVCGHTGWSGKSCTKTGGTHKQIWINDYIKGPQGLPLDLKKSRVFALVR